MNTTELQALRKQFRRTQQQVAEAAGISLRQYQNYEGGKTPITEKVKDELIRAIHENKKRLPFLDLEGKPSIQIKSVEQLNLEVYRLNATVQTLTEAVAVLWGRYKGVTDFEALRELRQKEMAWREGQ